MSAGPNGEESTMPPKPVRSNEPATLPPRTEAFIASPRDTVPATAEELRPDLPALPGYEILAELERGGMGVVYKARQIKLQRIVALKMILAGSHAGEADLARFRIEAEAIARLKHANVIQIYDVSEHEGKPYFSLEYCGGGSLAQQINGTPLTPRDAAQIVELLARGMDAAHQAGVIHRDLKPANVLLSGEERGARDETATLPSRHTPRPSSVVPKITDFGLAKKLDDAGQTQSGAVMGTPSYMAPEQASGKSSMIGPPADIYALGAILYELLTGRPPFKAATPLDTIMQVVQAEPVPPSQLQSKMPRDVETICLKCLAKEPAKRYASAAALADDLGRFLRGEPIEARPVGATERTWRWCRRNPLIATASAAAILGVLLALGTFAVAFVVISESLKNETAEREKAENLATANGLLAEKEKKLAEANKQLADQEARARKEADDRREQADKLAQANKKLADQEAKAREEADERREKAEELALQVRFDSFQARAAEDSNVALVGSAGLLPSATRLKSPLVADSLRLHMGAWSGATPRLTAIFTDQGVPQHAMALSPDGKAALTVSTGEGKARLWDTATGKSIGPALGDRGLVVCDVFSADGKTVLTGGPNARAWDAVTGKPIGPELPCNLGVRGVAISADGKVALVGGVDSARAWETVTGKPIGPPVPKIFARAVALSADGKTALAVNGKNALLWETATGKPIGAALQHKDSVEAVSLSADGKVAMTGSRDQTARLWYVVPGKFKAGEPPGPAVATPGPILQHQDVVSAVALSADGKVAISGSQDKTARLWRMGRPIVPLQHSNMVQAVALSGDGKSALTMCIDSWTVDRPARFWNVETGAPIGPPLLNRGAGIALSADGKTALTGDARLWKIASGASTGMSLPHPGGVQLAVLSADGKKAVTTSSRAPNTTIFWETATGKAIGPPVEHNGFVTYLVLSADGKLALMGDDKAVRLWDMTAAKPIGPALKHQGLAPPALSRDGKIALISDGTAQLWEALTGKQIGSPLVKNQGLYRAMALSADSKTALVTANDPQLFDATTGKPIGPPLPHRTAVEIALVSADGKTVLTKTLFDAAWLWKGMEGNAIAAPLPHVGVRAVALSADGKIALTGGRDNCGRLWHAATGKPLGPPLRHQGTVSIVALSADGKIALTASHDLTARLWDTATGKPLGLPIFSQDHLRNAALSADGKVVLTVHLNDTARLCHISPPLRGDPERIRLWTELITGLQVDELTGVNVLDAADWRERHQRLQELGGPPSD